MSKLDTTGTIEDIAIDYKTKEEFTARYGRNYL